MSREAEGVEPKYRRQVAAHFAAGGGANGFMPRDAYAESMLALVVGLPTLLAGLAALAFAGFIAHCGRRSD